MTNPTRKRRKVPPNERGLLLKRNTYYHRYYIKSVPSWIRLCTSDRKKAIERNTEVLKNIEDVKLGKPVYFYWLNENYQIGSKTEFLTIAEKYLEIRKQEKISIETIKIINRALDKFESANGNIEIKKINMNHIYRFKEYLDDSVKQTKEGSIPLTDDYKNINIRSVNTFMRWCYENEYIRKLYTGKQIRIPKSPPRYFSNAEYNRIRANLAPQMRRIIDFYRETGFRLNEPLIGHLRGKYFIIDAEDYKTKREHKVPLTEIQISVVKELQSLNYRKEYYSHKFKEACKKVGIKKSHFHNLRHTFALRKYLETRDIYLVKKLLGHSTIKTTEMYAEFDFEEMFNDFPDLSKVLRLSTIDRPEQNIVSIAINH